ncbi:ABC transporter transmembrane domain-containing protein [Polycladidibacter stylochi]|uniref:ABC transporter transmembrane domain-containing protein n=1 Tax=Polycladidibacter stylochi TaxID=1807766 RepID=UPI0008367733|nr:ABC transporter transmembrane domain-containing protein [Pseudovibrio stylochi]
MEKSLIKFIWSYSSRYQLVILFATCLSYPVSYILLELPKQITNEAISGTDFPKNIAGYSLGQIEYLLVLCLLFLFLVIVSNGFKLFLNIYKGRLGERMLRRLRFDLYQRVLRFPLSHFKKVSSGQIIPMVTAEVEAVGGFIGEALALPAYQGGMLAVQIGFIFMQDAYLGLAAISLYPIQGYIIPKLQKRVLRLSRQRVQNVRVMADRLGETIQGVTDIHANDTSAYHSADFADRLYKNFKIRFDIYNRKYLIKFINNFMNQLTPFFFYLIGGYLAIKGELSIGALLAVIAAYKDLAGPWKELLAYYQLTADVNIKYQTVIENFDPANLKSIQKLTSDEVQSLKGPLVLEDVVYQAEVGASELDNINCQIPYAEHCSILGSEADGRKDLLMIMAGLLDPDKGVVKAAGHCLSMMSEATLGRKIAYAGPKPHIWTGTLRDNICYGLRHRPQSLPLLDKQSQREMQRWLYEAKMTSNPQLLSIANWDDLATANVTQPQQLDNNILEICEETGLSQDLYRLGLQAILNKDDHHELQIDILKLREEFAKACKNDSSLAKLIEPWERDRFNKSATLVQNLFYAVPRTTGFKLEDLLADKRIKTFIEKSGLYEPLVTMGYQTISLMVELFADISPDSELFSTYAFISYDDLPHYQSLLQQCGPGMSKRPPSDKDKKKLVSIALRLVPTKHRLGVVTEDFQAQIVTMRNKFIDETSQYPAQLELFDEKTYMQNLSVEANIIFGTVKLTKRDARQRIETVIREMVEDNSLVKPIRLAGLEYHVGIAGARLNDNQKRQLGLVRALMKQADIVILDEALASKTLEGQQRREALQKYLRNKTLIVGTTDPEIASQFPRQMQLKSGQLANSQGIEQQETDQNGGHDDN